MLLGSGTGTLLTSMIWSQFSLVCTSSVGYRHWYLRSLELVTYFGMVYFLNFQMKSIVHTFSGCNDFFASWEFFSLPTCTIFRHLNSICLCFSLSCIVVPNVSKWSLFEVYRSVMDFGVCGIRFRNIYKKINILHLTCLCPFLFVNPSIFKTCHLPGTSSYFNDFSDLADNTFINVCKSEVHQFKYISPANIGTYNANSFQNNLNV